MLVALVATANELCRLTVNVNLSVWTLSTFCMRQPATAACHTSYKASMADRLGPGWELALPPLIVQTTGE